MCAKIDQTGLPGDAELLDSRVQKLDEQVASGVRSGIMIPDNFERRQLP
jgi:hypothetical protein